MVFSGLSQMEIVTGSASIFGGNLQDVLLIAWRYHIFIIDVVGPTVFCDGCDALYAEYSPELRWEQHSYWIQDWKVSSSTYITYSTVVNLKLDDSFVHCYYPGIRLEESQYFWRFSFEKVNIFNFFGVFRANPNSLMVVRFSNKFYLRLG